MSSSSYKLFFNYESKKYRARLTELAMDVLKREICEATKMNESESLRMEIADGEGCSITTDKHIKDAFQDIGDGQVIFTVSIAP